MFFARRKLKASATIALFVAVCFFWIANWEKGIWIPEEPSQYFPWKSFTGLTQTTYLFDESYIDGRTINQLPLGFFFGLFDIFAPRYALPIITTIFLTLLIVVSLYLFFGRFAENFWIKFILVCYSIFTFVGLNTSMYLSKSLGITYFLLVFWTTTSPTFRPAVLILVSVLTLGMLSNLAVTVSALLGFLVALLFRMDMPNFREKFIEICKYFTLTIGVISFPIYHFYFSQNQISSLLDQASATNFIMESNSRFIIGSGYWAENQTFQGLPYFPWSPTEESSYYWVRMLGLAIAIGLILLGHYSLFKTFKNSDKVLNLEYRFRIKMLVRLSVVIGVMGLLIYLPESRNPIALVASKFEVFSAFREPWAKFDLIFIVMLHALIGYALQNLVTNRKNHGKLQKVLRRRTTNMSPYYERVLSSYVTSSSIWSYYWKHVFSVLSIIGLLPAYFFLHITADRQTINSPPFINSRVSMQVLLTEIDEVSLRVSQGLAHDLKVCIYTDKDSEMKVINSLFLMALGTEKSGPSPQISDGNVVVKSLFVKCSKSKETSNRFVAIVHDQLTKHWFQ
jgi:hypothetical protein